MAKVKRFRKINIVAAIIASLCTCGLYFLPLFKRISRNNNKMAKLVGVKKVMPYLLALLLGILTCGIVYIVWAYQLNKQQIELGKKFGFECTTKNAIVNTLLSFIPFVNVFILATNHNKTIKAYKAHRGIPEGSDDVPEPADDEVITPVAEAPAAEAPAAEAPAAEAAPEAETAAAE